VCYQITSELRSIDLFNKDTTWHSNIDDYHKDVGEYVKKQKKSSKNDSGQVGVTVTGEEDFRYILLWRGYEEIALNEDYLLEVSYRKFLGQ
jgi:hypothetical protein